MLTRTAVMVLVVMVTSAWSWSAPPAFAQPVDASGAPPLYVQLVARVVLSGTPVTVAALRGELFVATDDGALHRVDRAGSVVWTRYPSRSRIAAVRAHPLDYLVLLTVDGALAAVDSRGSTIWQHAADNRRSAGSALVPWLGVSAEGVVYVVEPHGAVRAFSPHGRLLWRWQHAGGLAAEPQWVGRDSDGEPLLHLVGVDGSIVLLRADGGIATAAVGTTSTDDRVVDAYGSIVTTSSGLAVTNTAGVPVFDMPMPSGRTVDQHWSLRAVDHAHHVVATAAWDLFWLYAHRPTAATADRPIAVNAVSTVAAPRPRPVADQRWAANLDFQYLGGRLFSLDYQQRLQALAEVQQRLENGRLRAQARYLERLLLAAISEVFERPQYGPMRGASLTNNFPDFRRRSIEILAAFGDTASADAMVHAARFESDPDVVAALLQAVVGLTGPGVEELFGVVSRVLYREGPVTPPVNLATVAVTAAAGLIERHGAAVVAAVVPTVVWISQANLPRALRERSLALLRAAGRAD